MKKILTLILMLTMVATTFFLKKLVKMPMIMKR